MAARLIRVSTRRTGRRRAVRVWVYDTVQELRDAGEAYNGNDTSHALGLTQVTVDQDGRPVTITVRLARGHLNSEIVTHECVHAAMALYRSDLTPADTLASDIMHHYNEELAHLVSDITARLVDRLYAHGYYAPRAAG